MAWRCGPWGCRTPERRRQSTSEVVCGVPRPPKKDGCHASSHSLLSRRWSGDAAFACHKGAAKKLLNVHASPVLPFAPVRAIDAGAERIIVVIHPDKLPIRDHLNPDEDHVGRPSVCGKATPSAAFVAVQVPETVDPMFGFKTGQLDWAMRCPVAALVLPGPVGVIFGSDFDGDGGRWLGLGYFGDHRCQARRLGLKRRLAKDRVTAPMASPRPPRAAAP